MILVIGCNRKEFNYFLKNQPLLSTFYFWRDCLFGMCFEKILNLNLLKHTLEELSIFATRLRYPLLKEYANWYKKEIKNNG